MNISVVTLFPEMVKGVITEGVVGRAHKRGLIQLDCINPRDFAEDIHRTVDGRPYGGGPGMVMRADCLVKVIRKQRQKTESLKTIYLSPQGKTLTQSMLTDLSVLTDVLFVCGRYEGIDQRVVDLEIDEEWSIGDYVLSGGELAAMVIIDGVARLLPDVLGHKESAVEDSFTDDVLDHPHFTRPESFEGLDVPSVLLSGDHGRIKKWRRQQSLGRTQQRRPDLLADKELSEQDAILLANFMKEIKISEVSHE